MAKKKKSQEHEEETETVLEETEAETKEASSAAETSMDETAEEKDSSDTENMEQDSTDELTELQDELEAEQNKYLRLLADFDNFKRRTQKDKEISSKFRAQSLLTDLLPVLDNFERALAVEAKGDEAVTIMKGVLMVQKSLLEAVKREGLEEIKSVGEPFDPNFHQAVMQEIDEQAEPGSVLQELQKGYTLKGRVLRPSMVKVNE